MKIKVSKNELYGVLKMTGKVVGPHKTVPMFENYMLVIDENGFTITGSDSSGMIVGKVETISIEDREPIKILVDKTLFTALGELSEQPIEIVVDVKRMHLVVNYHNGVFELQGSDAVAYPQLTIANDPILVSFPKQQLIEGMKTVIPFVASDELRPIMSGIYIEFKEGRLSFVSTDTHILALREYISDLAPEQQFGAVIPTKASKVILSVISENKTDDILAKISNKNIGIETEKYTLTYRLIEGKFPNYRNVIPKTYETKITLNTDDFISVIRRISVFSNASSRILKMKVNAGVIRIAAEDIDYSISAKETIFSEVEGNPINIGFNSVCLAEILGAINTETCEFKLIDASRAGIIHPIGTDGITLLIMPMLINK